MFQFEFQKRRFAFYEAASTFDLCEPCALRAERVGGPYAVRRKRVVIIEYAWITGATAISAVGQILELGASSVVLLPIARAIDSNRVGQRVSLSPGRCAGRCTNTGWQSTGRDRDRYVRPFCSA
jgi:hypothetical protein